MTQLSSLFAAGSGEKWELLHVQDQKASGSPGGTSAAASYQTRTLNTVVTNEINGSSLASNQVTLPAGTYYFEASAPGRDASLHKVKLQNITDASVIKIGSSEYSSNLDNINTRSFVSGNFSIHSTKVL